VQRFVPGNVGHPNDRHPSPSRKAVARCFDQYLSFAMSSASRTSPPALPAPIAHAAAELQQPALPP
jgi:hypothetical protein